MSATTFRKKPVEIEAWQFDGTNRGNIIAWMREHGVETVNPLGSLFLISTLEGTMTADIGDWIIKGVKGEFYPCKPDIFDLTYDAA